MFSGRELTGGEETANDLREIEKLNASEEVLIELNARLGELANRIAISGKITNAKLTKEKKETKGRNECLAGRNTALRSRLRESNMEDFVIGPTQHPEEIALRKDRFPSQFRDIGKSGFEISPENEARREEDQLSEMGYETHFESESIPHEELLPVKEEPITRPMTRFKSGSLGKKWIWVGNTLLSMQKSRISDPRGVNQASLD